MAGTCRELPAHLPLPRGCVGEMHTLPLLEMQFPLLAHAAERRCRYSSFVCTCAAPRKLWMHLLERQPCSWCAGTNLNRGPCLSQPVLLPAHCTARSSQYLTGRLLLQPEAEL